MQEPQNAAARHWRATLRLVGGLLAVWFVTAFGLGIVLVEPLNSVKLGGFPLGFWFAQQGAIYIFIVLIFIYARRMDAIDAQHAPGDDGEDEAEEEAGRPAGPEADAGLGGSKGEAGRPAGGGANRANGAEANTGQGGDKNQDAGVGGST